MECGMSEPQKSSWQKLKEEKYLSISLAWVWRVCSFAIICIFVLPFFIDDLTQVRNFILIVGALLAIPLALHRMIIADNQLKATEKQIKQTDEENKKLREDAQRQRRDDNFENLKRDLSSENKIQVSYAIDQLWKLAQSHPRDYHIRLMKSLSELLEKMPYINRYADNFDLAMIFLKSLTNLENRHQKTTEQKREDITNDYHIRLQSLEIRGVNLSEADFSRFILKDVEFHEVDLTRTIFSWTMLDNIKFPRSNLTGAHFDKVFLQSANFAESQNSTEASWENISIPENSHPIFAGEDHRALVMQSAKTKSKDEWMAERQAELDKIKQSQKSSS